MRLENSWRIELVSGNKKAPNDFKFVQYIEAGNMDDAIKKAANSFEGRLHELTTSGATAQKACQHTKLKGRLRFGFKGGWLTESVDGLTIFQAMNNALKRDFLDGNEITEIMSTVN